MGEWITTTLATCENAGEQTKKCKNCNATQKQSISALEHSYDKYNVCETCTALNPECLEYLEFTLLDNGSYSISAKDISKIPSNLAIPHTYNSKLVTAIADSAFYECANLTNIDIPNSITSIGSYAFSSCSIFSTVYYKGTEANWNKITVQKNNDELLNATCYYYSETEPTTDGNYWHYVDGVPTPWIKED